MLRSSSVILFKIGPLFSDGDGESGGVPPFMAVNLPLQLNTSFGRTDSDIKGPGIPKPIGFQLRSRVFNLQRARRVPPPATYLTISGITRDNTGAILGNCVVDLFDTLTDAIIERTTSDADGVYGFRYASTRSFYVVAYKAGSPDVAGTSVNTLTGG